MELQDFKEYLFLVSRDVDDELEEFVEVEGESKIAGWLISIFEDWAVTAKSLSHKGQNKVLWRIGGYPLFIGAWYDLEPGEGAALFEAAKEVTLSIPTLFPPGQPMENGYFMWWDLLITHIISAQAASVCLEVLAELSLHPDMRVQMAALHGLGHLDHPGRPAVVDEFIRRHPDLKDDEWTLQCRNGTVM